jgi:hypothetical protein
MAKATLSPDDKLAVKTQLTTARSRLDAAHEASDKRKARHARRGIRVAKRKLRAIARIPAPAAAESAE